MLPDDNSGNRRYVAVEVHPPGATREEQSGWVRDYCEANRVQLWAEALHLYLAGAKSYLGGEYEMAQDRKNAEYTRANPAMETIVWEITAAHADGGPVKLEQLMMEKGLAADLADAEDKMRSVGRKLPAGSSRRNGTRAGRRSGACTQHGGSRPGRMRPRFSTSAPIPSASSRRKERRPRYTRMAFA